MIYQWILFAVYKPEQRFTMPLHLQALVRGKDDISARGELCQSSFPLQAVATGIYCISAIGSVYPAFNATVNTALVNFSRSLLKQSIRRYYEGTCRGDQRFHRFFGPPAAAREMRRALK